MSFCLRSSQQSRPTLDGPGQQYLRRCLSYSLRDSQNDWVFEWTWPYSVTQGCKGQQHNPFFLTKLKKLRLRKVRVRLHLNHRRLNPRGFVKGLKFFQSKVA